MRVIFLGDKLKTALITGASGGIGKAIVKAFLSQGYFVLGQYNSNEQAMIELKDDLKVQGLSDYFFAIKADLSKSQGVNHLFETVSKSFKSIDVLVNNAGVDLYKLVTDTSEEEWDYSFNVNVKAGFMLSKLFLPAMICKQKGKIIFVSSIWGNNGASMEAVYSASKWAVNGFCKSLAKEVASSGITVNCVSPGVVDTKMNERFNQEEVQSLIEATPLGRMCKPEEVASLITFLASESADFITGANITIDGGFTL